MTTGLQAGEGYTIRIAGATVATGTASGSGPLERRVTLPALARDARAEVTVTGSEQDRVGVTTVRVLTDKTLRSRFKKKVAVGERQRIRIAGLAAGERVTVRYHGKRISARHARANVRGVYRLSFWVGAKPGRDTVKATGRFPGRTVTMTFKVTRR